MPPEQNVNPAQPTPSPNVSGPTGAQQSIIAGPGAPLAPPVASPHPMTVIAEAPHVEPFHNLEEVRAVFWQNVVREMLTAMPGLASSHPELMDGRIAVLTNAGERIPIASVEPLFPCSLLAPDSRQLCMAIQGTVFNIRTPNGEIFTVPLREIRAVHTLSDELLHELEKIGRQFAEDGGEGEEPFGFAAFQSLRKQQRGNASGAAAPTAASGDDANGS